MGQESKLPKSQTGITATATTSSAQIAQCNRRQAAVGSFSGTLLCATLVRQSSTRHGCQTINTRFKRSPKAAVQSVLDALEELGMVENTAAYYRLAG